jgi:hypothetical protein
MIGGAVPQALDERLAQRARPDVQPAPENHWNDRPWRVRKPGVDGIITRYEGFDTRPPLIG